MGTIEVVDGIKLIFYVFILLKRDQTLNRGEMNENEIYFPSKSNGIFGKSVFYCPI